MPYQKARKFIFKKRKLINSRTRHPEIDCPIESRRGKEFSSSNEAKTEVNSIETKKIYDNSEQSYDISSNENLQTRHVVCQQKKSNLSDIFVLHLFISPSTQDATVSPVSPSNLDITNPALSFNSLRNRLNGDTMDTQESFECVLPDQPGKGKERVENLDYYKMQKSTKTYISIVSRHSSEEKVCEEETNIENSEHKVLFHIPDNIKSLECNFSGEMSPSVGCECTNRVKNPPIPMHMWPQSPLLLCPTPGSGTRVRGIRYSSSESYIWDGKEHSTQPWWQAFQKDFNNCNDQRNNSKDAKSYSCKCHNYSCLPINNGNESIGQSLVIDFESDFFEGTLLLRIRSCTSLTTGPYVDTHGYFSDLNRQYQAVVMGKFKKAGIPMTECVTGNSWSSPLAKLPPKLMLRGALKIASFFAPQVKNSLCGPNPYSLAPLCSVPQVIIADKDFIGSQTEALEQHKKYAAGAVIDGYREEPLDHTKSIMYGSPREKSSLSNDASHVARGKRRKKVFDKLFSANDKTLRFQTDVVYTFEFLQHLLDFNEYHLDLGRVCGHLSLEKILHRQPIQIMAGHKITDKDYSAEDFGTKDIARFWSFDICHEKLFNKVNI